jgi:putative FmdB family regulatory protein
MTYEYQCDACGHAWEAQQPISAPALTECPNCKKNTAKRMVSGGQGFILKGGGWYADGYGSAKPIADKPSETSSGTSPTDATKTAAKPAEKPVAGEKPATAAAETKKAEPATKADK